MQESFINHPKQIHFNTVIGVCSTKNPHFHRRIVHSYFEVTLHINNPIHHTIIRAVFVRLFVPLLLRGPLTDLRQTWWGYVGGPQNCPWRGSFLKSSTGQRVKRHFFGAYDPRLRPHHCKRRAQQESHGV